MNLIGFAAVVLLCQSVRAQGPAAQAPRAAGFDNFIARSGDKLMDGAKEWRSIGVNMPGLILPYDFTLRIPGRMTFPTPWEQEDGFKTLAQMNARCVRWWNLPMRAPAEKGEKADKTWHYVQGPGQFNDESFKTIDQALALAGRHGVRVIFSITAEAGSYLGGIGTYAAHRGKKAGDFYKDPELKEDFKATIRYVLNRKNTITGAAYKDDKAVLCWEFGNELRTAPLDWQGEMAAYIKSIDRNHLVMTGRDNDIPAELDTNIDVYTRHYYGGDWIKNCRSDLAKTKGKRAFIVGEFGLSADVPMVRSFLDEVVQNGASGALIWSMYFHHRDGGFYWHQIFTHASLWSYHWPGFASASAQKEKELLETLRGAAFRIQGLPVPPLPAPEAPELLPIGDVPLLSWRGSAGASGYDVERSAAASGPWRKIGDNVSDADVAYRPLFSDTGAVAGETYYYRAIARNSSGQSSPSNVVGPVKVSGACLVDELMDLSLAHAKSDALTLVNDHNAFCAEHLFRAKGDKGQWIAYKTPGRMTAFKAVAWFAGQGPDLAFQASGDGAKYADVTAKREVEEYRNAPTGKAKTQVRYQGALPSGTTFLKIAWTAPAELDRVELYHAGGPPR